jgi:crossover junction endodeoxyribonuclease RuvC
MKILIFFLGEFFKVLFVMASRKNADAAEIKFVLYGSFHLSCLICEGMSGLIRSFSFSKNSARLQQSAKIILGIDPGTLLMGYGIIEISQGKMRMREMETLRLSGKKDNHSRLHLIHQKVSELIQIFRPHEFAIEAPFFGKNVQSMLKLGRAQGVAIAAAMQAGIPVTEYSPRKVKQSITGNGNADKEQVWKMLRTLLNLEIEPAHFDATDALAIAVCHHFQASAILASGGEKFNGWGDFVKKNPEKFKSQKSKINPEASG